MARQQDELAKSGAQVLGVSRDTKFVHLAWRREEKLLKDVRYPLASDPTGAVSRLFGVLDEASGLAFRGTFIIAPDGKLTGSEINFFNVGRSAEELVRKVKAERLPRPASPGSLSGQLVGGRKNPKTRRESCGPGGRRPRLKRGSHPGSPPRPMSAGAGGRGASLPPGSSLKSRRWFSAEELPCADPFSRLF